MNVNQISFAGNSATTKKGNEYKKTNVGKMVMTSLATGSLCYSLYKNSKRPNGFNSLFTELGQIVAEKAPNIKNIKKAGVILYAATTALIFGTAIGVGSIIDGITNKIRAKKADKAAE